MTNDGNRTAGAAELHARAEDKAQPAAAGSDENLLLLQPGEGRRCCTS